MSDLNQKQQIFVAEYLKDGNGTRSAIAAGYRAKTAESAASRMLRNVKVGAEIVKKREKIRLGPLTDVIRTVSDGVELERVNKHKWIPDVEAR